ncbi:MAG: N-acetylmuramoyl-L-alanine amidase [Verrucomicrobiales bacterium]|nr:N-acetylmuramoyl-L-alanine amidase [Verrucomicrobiales bacterium]
MVVGTILPGCAHNRGKNWEAKLGPVPEGPIAPEKLKKEIRVKQDHIPKGRFGRRLNRPMRPQFITVHSTQNYTGDAFDHAKALKRGALRGGVCGFLCWHFTVQDNLVVQHIPTDEQGEHADFDGPGNRYSIGIEMCEHKGNDQAKTIDRTAKLTAALMYENDIPIDRVVPHYHWPRRGYKPPNKNCPHFLMDDGKPRGTWNWFLARVESHHQRLVQHAQLLEQQQQEQNPIPKAPPVMQVKADPPARQEREVFPLLTPARPGRPD